MFLCALVAALFAACAKEDVFTHTDTPEAYLPAAVEGEVRITLPEGSTRTAYDEGTRAALFADGKNILWQTGDRFKLVARDANGVNAFTPCMFSYWLSTVEGCRSFFRGRPDATMIDGTYTYYAVFPSTAQISDTEPIATFTLLATQNGKYSGEHDFMVAKGVGGALVTCDDDPVTQETMNDMNVTFCHQLHALRFEIPQNGMPANIRRVHIFFSGAVAGDLSVNIESGEITTANTTNKLTIDFGEGNEKQSGDEFWAMILPQSDTFARQVDIRFEDAAGNYSTRQMVTFPQVCSKGHITPIKINAPSSVVGYTYLKCTTSHEMEHLGENVEEMHLTLPEGCYFSDYSTTHEAPEDSNGVHTFTLFNDIADLDEVRYTPITLKFDSEHASIPVTVTLGDSYTVGGEVTYPLTTPWLFSEDFFGVDNFDDGHDNPRTGLGSDTWVGINELSTKTPKMKDWWATRIGVQSERVRICCRYQNVLGGKAYYKGRLYTPFLINLKPGASVSVSVSFKYGGAYSGNSKGKGTLYFGTDTQKAPVNADDTGLLQGVGGAGFGNNVPVSLSNLAINGEELPTSGGSFTSTLNNKTVTVNNVTSGSRLAWIVSSTNTASNTNANYWLYMDNIQVKIAQ